MSIAELYSRDEPVVSFEFFPPKTDAGFRSLFRTIRELKALEPGFVSITMGAGGSARAKTVELVIRIQRELGITAMAHLPCTGFERHEIAGILDRLQDNGVRSVLALRGDPPRQGPACPTPAHGFHHANELAQFIAQRDFFDIGGACYPEVHPEAPDAETDLQNLLRKLRAGCGFLITQLFFENRCYFEFVERARAAGVEAPIVPGIMPITSVAGVRRMSSLGGVSIPAPLEAELGRVGDDDRATCELGVEWATQQCRELLEHGVPGLHFYTLNRSPATRRIYRALL